MSASDFARSASLGDPLRSPLAPVRALHDHELPDPNLQRTPPGLVRTQEQRREVRRSLGQRPAGDLVIYPLAATPTSEAGLDPTTARKAGAGVPVVALRDASASGLSVFVNQSLEPGQAISLELRSGGMRLDFSGQVAWCARAAAVADGLSDGEVSAPGTHMLGLALTGQQALAAMLGI